MKSNEMCVHDDKKLRTWFTDARPWIQDLSGRWLRPYGIDMKVFVSHYHFSDDDSFLGAKLYRSRLWKSKRPHCQLADDIFWKDILWFKTEKRRDKVLKFLNLFSVNGRDRLFGPGNGISFRGKVR